MFVLAQILLHSPKFTVLLICKLLRIIMLRKRDIHAILWGVLAFVPISNSCPLPLPETYVAVGEVSLVVEVANTHKTRYCGLSLRNELRHGSGMLFVFRDEQPRHFTMRDTRIPLSIAFIDNKQHIIDIQQMDPMLTNVVYTSKEAARYAIEVNQGWFRDHQVGIGDWVEFILPPDMHVE